MNRRNASGLLAVIVYGISVGNVAANGFGLASQDGFATARGEAFVATADNASAIYYNPAGITQLEGNNLRAGLYSIYLDPTFSPPNSDHTYNIGKHYNFIPQAFFTHSFAGAPVSIGLGIYAPYGGNMDWPQNITFRPIGTKSSLKYFRVNPVVALKLFPQLSIGGGVMVDYGKIDLESGIRQSQQPLTNFFRFKGDGWNVGYNLGVLWQPVEQISLGATFRSATPITMKGHTEEELQPLVNTVQTPAAQADFTFPLTAVVGISYRPTPKWNLEFDANYTDWSCFGTITIHQSKPPAPFLPATDLTLDWQPSWMYEFGVTRYFDSGWHVSVGYVYNENSVPNAYYTPLVADLDRHFFSTGLGYNGKRFDFDIAYQFGYGPAHTVTGSTPSSLSGQFSGQTANGTYHFISHAVLVTVGMHF